MSLLHLKLEDIKQTDLQRLVDDSIPESKVIEFKEVLNYVTDEQKRELLSDISALANSEGGDLILGLKAEKGIATDLIGLRKLVPDDAIGKIENMLRDFIQPRILGIKVHSVALTTGNHVLIVRTPKSFASPHMVKHQGIIRFCGRNSNGKYDLDVHELRSAFVANEAFADRLKAFRLDRINRLVSGNYPAEMSGKHMLVVHLLPVMGARSDVRLGTSELERIKAIGAPRPIGSNGWGPSFNFDGLLVSSRLPNRKCYSYVQIMRNGYLEAVTSDTLDSQSDSGPYIPSIDWEESIIDALPSWLTALATLEMSPPFTLSISLLNVRGFRMAVSPRFSRSGIVSVDREHLLTQEVLVDSTEEHPGRMLRPLFDQVWNACGWPGSLNYDAQGNWRHHE